MRPVSNRGRIASVTDEGDLTSLLNGHFRREGFVKKGRNWRKEYPEMLAIASLQKSRWGAPRYYLHLGVLPKALDPKELPKVNQCPLSIGLEDLVEYFRARSLLDLDDFSISPKARAEGLNNALDDQVRSFFDRCSTLAGTRAYLNEHPKIRYGTWAVLRELLSIPAD